MTPALLPLAALLALGAAASEAPAASPDAPAPAAAPALAEPQGTPALLVMKDGQQLRGRLIAQDAAGATLELPGGSRVVVPAASILRIELAKAGQTEVRSRDPNRTRYLYSPSGFMLHEGEGYVSQTELLFTSVAYGVTDHVTVGLGTMIPALFVQDGFNLLGTVKAGLDVTEHVHVAVGGQTLWLPGLDAGTTGGVLFGALTLGTPDLHLGVAAGPLFVTGNKASDFGDVLMSVSGNARVSEHLALVSENWFLPGSSNSFVLSGALRIIFQRLGVDVGLLFPKGSDVPIPWLDFTWNFGTR
ncbi:MAG: hypothetical protein U0229_09700 [Anaeromyxobacter sp.]